MNNEKFGKGVGFERLRRITGYLVGTLDRWNNAKKAEEKDRVKHGLGEDTNLTRVKHSTQSSKDFVEKG